MRIEWKKNLGAFDRVIRVIIGLYLLYLVFSSAVTGLWAVVAAILALSQFVEAALAY